MCNVEFMLTRTAICRSVTIIFFSQGGEGDCFYVVGSGEFEVFATQVLIFLPLSSLDL